MLLSLVFVVVSFFSGVELLGRRPTPSLEDMVTIAHICHLFSGFLLGLPTSCNAQGGTLVLNTSTIDGIVLAGNPLFGHSPHAAARLWVGFYGINRSKNIMAQLKYFKVTMLLHKYDSRYIYMHKINTVIHHKRIH